MGYVFVDCRSCGESICEASLKILWVEEDGIYSSFSFSDRKIRLMKEGRTFEKLRIRSDDDVYETGE